MLSDIMYVLTSVPLFWCRLLGVDGLTWRARQTQCEGHENEIINMVDNDTIVTRAAAKTFDTRFRSISGPRPSTRQ